MARGRPAGSAKRLERRECLGGGLSPQGQIQIHVSSEGFAIPQRIEQEILPNGTAGKELDRLGKDGVVREMETSLVMDLSVAKRLHLWLGEHIQTLEKLQSEPRGAEAEEATP